MDANFQRSATYYGTSARSQGLLQRAIVPDVERSLLGRLQGMGTWHMISASLGDRLMQVIERLSA